jgi:GNAT superfamily N-acetyltransferase
VLRLARLAVDERARGRGIGAQLLRQVFALALGMSSELGGVGVVVDAKPEAVAFYRRFNFLPLDPEGDPLAATIPLFVPLDVIRGALG